MSWCWRWKAAVTCGACPRLPGWVGDGHPSRSGSRSDCFFRVFRLLLLLRAACFRWGGRENTGNGGGPGRRSAKKIRCRLGD